MARPLISILFTALLLVSAAAARGTDDPDQNLAQLQVFLGVLELDDQTGDWDEISDGDVDVDFSSLPGAGIETEYVFYRGWLHVGLNPGLSFAWKNDDTNFSGGFTNETGGVLRVDVDNSLLLVELHLGGYVRGRLSERITSYAAAGPMLIYGSHDVEDESVEPESDGSVELTEQDSDDITVGYYARAGIDFEIEQERHVGFSIRYMSAELDFDNTIGELDIEGPQYLLTYTQDF